MLRPMQPKRLVDAEATTIYAALDEALYSVQNAMYEVSGYEALTDIFSGLDQMFDEIKALHEQYEEMADEERRAEDDMLTREYFASVL